MKNPNTHISDIQMKRIQKKIKDLIKVGNYEHVRDFLADPARTISNYHYTPMTSELMTKWIDALVGVRRNNGKAKAIAGYCGVGKSHFLANLGAIIEHPELRSEIKDSHVLSSVHNLQQCRYQVAYVMRGTKSTFMEELTWAIENALAVSVSDIYEDMESLIRFASGKTGELPFIIIVDTYQARMAREDGSILGELVEIAKNYNVFTGIALDEYMFKSDGNKSVMAHIKIDYLSEESLYHIVNAHIFPKYQRKQSLIQEIYNEFRSLFPSFRWSEELFKSLYPLHPSILEVAPYVRFYAPEFSFLGFAARVGAKILGRPVDSLISLDEVFDNFEVALRKSPELQKTFEVYDKITKKVIYQMQIKERLQAKLILKTLFILSLNDSGASAEDVNEAMLSYDNGDSQKSVGKVAELLDKFVSTFPDVLLKEADKSNKVRYSIRASVKEKLDKGERESSPRSPSNNIKTSVKEELDRVLEEISKNVGEESISHVLLRAANDRFKDWKFAAETSREKKNWSEHRFLWRGGYRHTRIFWNWNREFAESSIETKNSGLFDLDIFICGFNKAKEVSSEIESQKVFWQTAELSPQEINTLKRFYVLLNAGGLREEFGEQFEAAINKYAAATEKIWNRAFLEDARLLMEGKKYEFSIELSKTHKISDLLSSALHDIFAGYYNAHPIFAKSLEMKDALKIVTGLFSDDKVHVAEAQKLAKAFALPLGLIEKSGRKYNLKPEEKLSELPLVNSFLGFIEQNEDETIELKTVYKQLKQKPFGLVREAQFLILSALVARRKIEFVTTRGERINCRSLGAKLVWDDIYGIAKTESAEPLCDSLTRWVKILAPIEGTVALNANMERSLVNDALSAWSRKWESSRVLERFSELPDEVLNTKIWHLYTRVEKVFKEVASFVKLVLNEKIRLEEGLQRIADTFSDSKDEFDLCQRNLIAIESFIDSAYKREKIWSYLAICDLTKNQNIEKFRMELLNFLDKTYDFPSLETNMKMENLWKKFHSAYCEYFIVNHNAIMKSHQLQKEFDKIQKSVEWWEFESLSRLPIFNGAYWEKAQRILKQYRNLDCNFDTKENLKTHPFCSCSFDLAQMEELAKLPESFARVIKNGSRSYRKTLHLMRAFVTKLIWKNRSLKKDKALSAEAGNLISTLAEAKIDLPLTTNQLSILNLVLDEAAQLTAFKAPIIKDDQAFASETLTKPLNALMEDTPNESVLAEIQKV